MLTAMHRDMTTHDAAELVFGLLVIAGAGGFAGLAWWLTTPRMLRGK